MAFDSSQDSNINLTIPRKKLSILHSTDEEGDDSDEGLSQKSPSIASSTPSSEKPEKNLFPIDPTHISDESKPGNWNSSNFKIKDTARSLKLPSLNMENPSIRFIDDNETNGASGGVEISKGGGGAISKAPASNVASASVPLRLTSAPNTQVRNDPNLSLLPNPISKETNGISSSSAPPSIASSSPAPVHKIHSFSGTSEKPQASGLLKSPPPKPTRVETSPDASCQDFAMLRSAMKKSSQESRRGKRRLSLLNSVMRRVSIHRKESTPTGRIATFFFGPEEEMLQDDSKDLRDVEASDIERDKVDKSKVHAAQLRESLFLILSGLYGIIIVILGAVIPITEIFISDQIESAFEAFYVYLYIVSILFLVYVYAYLLRRNRLKTEFLTRTLSRSLSWTKAWAKSWARGENDRDAKGKLRKRMISLDVSNHHTGTFYLRLGVLGFGIGSMIHSGLNFGTFFSVSDTSCNEPLQAIKPMIHLVFTFFQLYFIFMNSKMCIHRYKKLARFGLMHMCATNICVWFRSIVVETLHVIHTHAHKEGGHGGGHHSGVSHSSHVPMVDHHDLPHGGSHVDLHETNSSGAYDVINATVNTGRKLHAAAVIATNGNDSIIPLDDSCQWSNMMGQAVEAAGPYLYPCTIEYSLMCAGILYIMWKNVGKKPRRPRQSELDEEEDDEHLRVHRMSVDCTGSSRGLFLGILLMVGTIISIIAFYMLVNQENLKSSAIILAHVSETTIYALTLIALILATVKMKSLTFHNEHEADLEDILILISYTGLLAFIIFSLVASILHDAETRSALTILSNVTMLIQATVQTIFMLAGDRLSAANESQERKKPGREFITFLLISNFAMWAINTFETQTPQHNPIQVEFYGPEAWAIFTHISVPLGIYYRFHSTVCFSNIWKNAWKIRKHI